MYGDAGDPSGAVLAYEDAGLQNSSADLNVCSSCLCPLRQNHINIAMMRNIPAKPPIAAPAMAPGGIFGGSAATLGSRVGVLPAVAERRVGVVVEAVDSMSDTGIDDIALLETIVDDCSVEDVGPVLVLLKLVVVAFFVVVVALTVTAFVGLNPQYPS